MNNKKQGLDPRFAALILVLAVVASGVAILLSRKGNDQVQEAAIEAPLVDNLAESTQTSTLPSERAATSPSTNSDSAASVIATVPQLEILSFHPLRRRAVSWKPFSLWAGRQSPPMPWTA